MNERWKVSPEVRDALAAGEGVVALESTIIAHGMPYPANVETALEVERIVRANGAVPATIAILGGEIRVGLDEQALDLLASAPDVAKVSRRDLGAVVARGLDGATTVAATMIIAANAGIEVFVTGGIGGVHRGVARSFDISADLTELGRTRVAVVCAGAKAILDLGLTLEVLETHGVPVIGFGTDRFPAFYTRDSGFGADYRVDSAAELASILKTQWDLGLDCGAVIANPIPREHEMEPRRIEEAIESALAEAAEQHISGKDVTPFLLSAVEALTGGASLEANQALIKSNARVGARLAVELAKLR